MHSTCWRAAFGQDKTRFWGRGNLFSLTSFLSATQLNFCTCMIHSIFISGKTRRLCALASLLRVQLLTNSVCDGISVLKHFASFPRKVAQDGIKKMRGFYQPWLQGKLQCHRRLIIPFRILFPILLSVADSCSLLVLRRILPVSLQLEVCLVTRRLSALPSSWRDEKTGNSPCYSRVSCLSWLSIKQKESWVLIEKKSLWLFPLRAEKENVSRNQSPDGCELHNFQETWSCILHLTRDCVLLLMESLSLMTQVLSIIPLSKPVPFHYVAIIISLSST